MTLKQRGYFNSSEGMSVSWRLADASMITTQRAAKHFHHEAPWKDWKMKDNYVVEGDKSPAKYFMCHTARSFC